MSRYVIADGTSILRNPTIYHSEAAARIAAEDAAITRGSDHVAVYSVETGACLFTVYRSDHGTRARAVASPVPYAPDGGCWLDQRDGSAATYVARFVVVPPLEYIRNGGAL